MRINPDDAIFHRNLGILLAQQGRTDEAIVQYREAVRVDPGTALADELRREISTYEAKHPQKVH